MTSKAIITFYIYQIQLERITIDDVPVKYRKDVEKALTLSNKCSIMGATLPVDLQGGISWERMR